MTASKTAAPARNLSWVRLRGVVAAVAVAGFFGTAVIAPLTMPSALAVDAGFAERIHQEFVPEDVDSDVEDLAINLAENEARIATATEAWAVVQTPEIDGEKFETLFFHPATKRWVWDKDPDYDLKECLLATVEAGEVALDYALGLNEETPRLMKVAIADGRISEIPEQSK